MKKLIALTLIALVSFGAFAGGSSETAAASPAASTSSTPAATTTTTTSDEPVRFVIANGAEPESLDPSQIQGVPEHRIYEALFEGLITIDPRQPTESPASPRAGMSLRTA